MRKNNKFFHLIMISLIMIGSFFLPTKSHARDAAVDGFHKRFRLMRDDQNKLQYIKLKNATTKFSISPLLNQIKADLLEEQNSYFSLTKEERKVEIDSFIKDLQGSHSQAFQGIHYSQELEKIKESLSHLPEIDVEEVFSKITSSDFWTEFETKLNKAFQFIDPRIMASLNDPTFFYKKNVTYKVVEWGLNQARSRFSEVPLLNIASFVIVRVHEMMQEQRFFHHHMLLHYFETIPETKLGMTKEEVDYAVSSLYEFRIDATNFAESKKAKSDWINYGMDKFYRDVRLGLSQMQKMKTSVYEFEQVKRLNFAFVELFEEGNRKIYHLFHKNHMFSQKPALAFDYSSPKKIKRNRALAHLAHLGLGFIPVPDLLKRSVENFIKSFYVQQVRTEGALIGYFESVNDQEMLHHIFGQRNNYYIK